MVTVTSTAVTTTYCKSIALDTDFTTTSASYVDVTGFSLATVPNGSKIYYSIYVSKSTAGTMSFRITDGTNVFKEEAAIDLVADNEAFSSLTGEFTQNSGSAATVKVQVLSSDGNNATVNANTSGSSWIACTDMTGGDPLVVAPSSSSAMSDAPYVFSGKRQIDQIWAVHPNKQVDGGPDDEFSVQVLGMNVEPDDIDNLTVNSTDTSPNVITSEIRIYPGHSAPVWAGSQKSRGCVIVAWSGFNIEVTG